MKDHIFWSYTIFPNVGGGLDKKCSTKMQEHNVNPTKEPVVNQTKEPDV